MMRTKHPTIMKTTRMITTYLSLCFLAPVTWGQIIERSPEQQITFPSKDTDVHLCGTSTNSLYVTHWNPPSLEVWQWRGGSVRVTYQVPIDKRTSSISILPRDRWLSVVLSKQTGKGDFCVGDLPSGRVIRQWVEPRDLCLSMGQASPDGVHLPVWGISDYNSSEPSNDRKNGVVCFGLVNFDRDAFDWAARVGSDRVDLGWSLRVVTSNNGEFIGVAGWKNGAALIDVASRKVLWVASHQERSQMRASAERRTSPWSEREFHSIGTDDVAFTLDGKLIYIGGVAGSESAGAVGSIWGMRTATGEVVSQWQASATRHYEYARRVTRLCVSPDGRFVAAGTVPNALVFLISATDGRHRIFEHGGPGARIDVVSFSPDSKRLASCGGGKMKIWKLP